MSTKKHLTDSETRDFLRGYRTLPQLISFGNLKVDDTLVLSVQGTGLAPGMDERVALRLIEIDDRGSDGQYIVYQIKGRVLDTTAPRTYPIGEAVTFRRPEHQPLYGYIVDHKTIRSLRVAYTKAEILAHAGHSLVDFLKSQRPPHTTKFETALHYLEMMYHLPPELWASQYRTLNEAVPPPLARKRTNWLKEVITATPELMASSGRLRLTERGRHAGVVRLEDTAYTRQVIRVDAKRLCNGILEVIRAFDCFEVRD